MFWNIQDVQLPLIGCNSAEHSAKRQLVGGLGFVPSVWNEHTRVHACICACLSVCVSL